MATIREIAELANVSIGTVSRVLNYDETINVADSTRKKIFEVAENLSYEPKPYKKIKKSYKIGLRYSYSLEEELMDTYYLSIRVALEKHIKHNNMKLKKIDKKSSLESTKGLDGIICLGVFDEKDVDIIRGYKKPTVFVDESPSESEFDSIIIDYKVATRYALNYLIDNGHKKIGLIGGVDTDAYGNKNYDLRQTEFESYLTKKKLYEEKYVRVGGYDIKDGCKLMHELMKLEDRPTGLFVSNDTIAIGCYKACNELGLKIPEDISIVGFNDISQSKYMIPPLTTVKLYTEFMGECAADLIKERLETGRKICKKIIIPTKLIVRDSVGNLN